MQGVELIDWVENVVVLRGHTVHHPESGSTGPIAHLSFSRDKL